MAVAPSWLILASWGGAGLVTAVGLGFAARQNRGRRMGGSISRAKQIWLIWAVYTWFVAAPLLAAAPVFSDRVRAVLGVFAVVMGLRGAVELVMLFVTKNWRPPLGIAHDVGCVVLLSAGLLWASLDPTASPSGLEAWGPPFLAVLAVSLGLETYYAVAFHRGVSGRTTGDEGVWFAADEPRFATVNRVTALANAPLVLFVAVLLLRLSGVP